MLDAELNWIKRQESMYPIAIARMCMELEDRAETAERNWKFAQTELELLRKESNDAMLHGRFYGSPAEAWEDYRAKLEVAKVDHEAEVTVLHQRIDELESLHTYEIGAMGELLYEAERVPCNCCRKHCGDCRDA
jgi:hypothetical protein